jgi:hypothetical protein
MIVGVALVVCANKGKAAKVSKLAAISEVDRMAVSPAEYVDE